MQQSDLLFKASGIFFLFDFKLFLHLEQSPSRSFFLLN